MSTPSICMSQSQIEHRFLGKERILCIGYVKQREMPTPIIPNTLSLGLEQGVSWFGSLTLGMGVAGTTCDISDYSCTMFSLL